MPRDTDVKKRTVCISGHYTSVTIEDDFWNVLKIIAEEKQTSLSQIITEIDENRASENLSSAIRLYILHDLLRKCGNNPPQ